MHSPNLASEVPAQAREGAVEACDGPAEPCHKPVQGMHESSEGQELTVPRPARLLFKPALARSNPCAREFFARHRAVNLGAAPFEASTAPFIGTSRAFEPCLSGGHVRRSPSCTSPAPACTRGTPAPPHPKRNEKFACHPEGESCEPEGSGGRRSIPPPRSFGAPMLPAG